MFEIDKGLVDRDVWRTEASKIRVQAEIQAPQTPRLAEQISVTKMLPLLSLSLKLQKRI